MTLTSQDLLADPDKQTPMMQQFLAAKVAHPDAILFFRMGDFYETFLEDAVEAAHLLDLTLTSRNKKDSAPIPMAGVPHHAAHGYIRRLLALGKKVAICEQVEDPKLAKGLVERRVVQVVTPGVILDTEALERGESNFLAAVHTHDNERYILALVDASTGHRRTFECHNVSQVLDELERSNATEVLLPPESMLLHAIRRANPQRTITTQAVGPSKDPNSHADRMLETYLAATQMNTALALQSRQMVERRSFMTLSATTITNLELVACAAGGGRKHSLLGLLDKTRSPMGARLLRQWLVYPLVDTEAIERRHASVEALLESAITRGELRDSLGAVRDLERLVTRVVARRAGPREVVALAESLEQLPHLVRTLETSGSPALAERGRMVDGVEDAAILIRSALADEPPALIGGGGAIQEGFHQDLDELIAIIREGKTWFQNYAETLRASSGIASLKIRYNQVFGYFIEVTRANLHRVPETWLRKQTLANSERYLTPELKERENQVLGAEEKRLALEAEIFEGILNELTHFASRVQETARHIAAIDVLQALAETAATHQYVRPEMHDGAELVLRDCRHPVIETLLAAGEFVPNDIHLDTEARQIMMITGPNMAGKSTVMRQVALAAIMAQMGGFVPASYARMGIADQVFTRVGASDKLTEGQSTFMVEMVEAARILHSATPRSLIIVDEIGRGTSTFDGVSIAWAVAEYLHDVIGARTLFATHYHELIELADTHPKVVNMTIAVKESGDAFVFLRRLVPGGTNRSYGIEVARLAGVPKPVLDRARTILANLETHGTHGAEVQAKGESPAPPDSPDDWQLSLFAADPRWTTIKGALTALQPDDMSPREALDALYLLKKHLTGKVS